MDGLSPFVPPVCGAVFSTPRIIRGLIGDNSSRSQTIVSEQNEIRHCQSIDCHHLVNKSYCLRKPVIWLMKRNARFFIEILLRTVPSVRGGSTPRCLVLLESARKLVGTRPLPPTRSASRWGRGHVTRRHGVPHGTGHRSRQGETPGPAFRI